MEALNLLICTTHQPPYGPLHFYSVCSAINHSIMCFKPPWFPGVFVRTTHLPCSSHSSRYATSSILWCFRTLRNGRIRMTYWSINLWFWFQLGSLFEMNVKFTYKLPPNQILQRTAPNSFLLLSNKKTNQNKQNLLFIIDHFLLKRHLIWTCWISIPSTWFDLIYWI